MSAGFTPPLCSRAANNSGVGKRQITDLVDQSIQINAHCFVVTADNRYVLVCGFWDKSFRVYSTETGGRCCVARPLRARCGPALWGTGLLSAAWGAFRKQWGKPVRSGGRVPSRAGPRGPWAGVQGGPHAPCPPAGKLTQIVFGHWDVVTCLARSESYIGGDCYIVSGSRDATLLLWYWSGRHHIIGDNPNSSECPCLPDPRRGLGEAGGRTRPASHCCYLISVLTVYLPGTGGWQFNPLLPARVCLCFFTLSLLVSGQLC